MIELIDLLPGTFWSLKPISIMFSKSSKRLSNSPIICMPSIGSPLNCTLSEAVRRMMSMRSKLGVIGCIVVRSDFS